MEVTVGLDWPEPVWGRSAICPVGAEPAGGSARSGGAEPEGGPGYADWAEPAGKGETICPVGAEPVGRMTGSSI